MTPAEVLAAAADKLDALVEDASPGPWRDMLMGSEGSTILAGGSTVSTARRVARASELDAPYIAAMNPLVGKALAGMLRTFSSEYVRETRHFHEMWNEAARVRMIGDRFPGFTEALALARLIIGGES